VCVLFFLWNRYVMACLVDVLMFLVFLFFFVRQEQQQLLLAPTVVTGCYCCPFKARFEVAMSLVRAFHRSAVMMQRRTLATAVVHKACGSPREVCKYANDNL
jgi:hypothetical protein